MQWLIDLVIEAIGIPPTFIDRGDPAAWDFETGDFTRDAAWHDLDLSAIVPAGATIVLISAYVVTSVLPNDLSLRKNGNVNEKNISVARPQVVNVAAYADMICPISTARKLEYKVSTANVYGIFLIVKGWWL